MRDLLPVGSVVLLKNAVKKAVIMGYFQKISSKGEEHVYDYMGVSYPEGFLGKGSVFLFDEDKIDKVCFRGYETGEHKGYSDLIVTVFKAAQKGLKIRSE